mgnify:FL=1
MVVNSGKESPLTRVVDGDSWFYFQSLIFVYATKVTLDFCCISQVKILILHKQKFELLNLSCLDSCIRYQVYNNLCELNHTYVFF